MAPLIRFDDLTSGSERSFEFSDPGEVVVARRPSEVLAALERVSTLSRSGWWVAGFVSYDAAPGVDPGLAVPGGNGAPDPPPLVWFTAYRHRIAVDPLEPLASERSLFDISEWKHGASREGYHAAIAEIRERISAGDTYQVNLTFRMGATFSGDPFAFYRDIALAQRGGCCAFVDAGRHQIVSASPETFFRVDGPAIRVKPMKGTWRRGRWPAEDDAHAGLLRASEKDQAENLMIVDLIRNDLGRIARFGSVVADRLLQVERFETVWQMTSEVSAELREDVGLVEIFVALFPSGSVTGAPKKKTMEIICGLEASPRGVYCGAIGYVAPHDERGLHASFSVAIRTAVIDMVESTIEYGVGGGITWDSTPDGEYREAMLKADVLQTRHDPRVLLETLRWDPGAGFWLLDGHLRRLEGSAGYFGFRYGHAEVVRALSSAVDGFGEERLVRLTLERSGRVNASVGEELGPVGRISDGEIPLRLAVSAEPVVSSDVLLFHKTTQREPYERRARARADVDDVILVNERGEVTESTIANVAVRIEGGWVTPPLASGCLPGIYRALLLEEGEVVERVVTLADLWQADGLAVINSVRGWRRAVLVE